MYNPDLVVDLVQWINLDEGGKALAESLPFLTWLDQSLSPWEFYD